MKTVGIIGANGVVGRTLQAEFKKIKTPFEVKLFGRQDEIPQLDAAVFCTDNPDSARLYEQLKDRLAEYDCFEYNLEDFKEKAMELGRIAKDNNIKLIRIPYWEFENIENILESVIN